MRLLLLLLPLLLWARQLTYDVYVYFFPVGKVEIKLTDEGAYARGYTKEGWRWLYSYDFEFFQNGEKLFLIEVEKGKKKLYEGRRVYEKKPWIPLLIEFLKTGKVRETELFKVKKDKTTLRVVPLKSKKVKEIIIKGGNPPKEIVIKGALEIKLVLKHDEGRD
ncbi:MAG: hypothetical protein GXO03_03840 [Aquificae bacterium]|nr:hypothetical protein [Aquificota bacterium]